MDDAKRYERLQALFDKAINRPKGQWDAYLEEACRDDRELADEVRILLEAHLTEAGLEFPRIDPPTLGLLDPGAARVGQRLGAFLVGEVIGRGGMSVVHRAQRQDADFEQTVAIKILPPPSDPQGLAHRFRNEVRIQADLGRHPRIVGLIDAGTTPEGAPYVIMDYIDGQRIDAYCDQHQLDVRARIRLFLQACEAVQYAHRHAVIHRDLKPSNILVDCNGDVHLIDFGIAKLIQEDPDHDEGPRTQTGYAPMTPRYASPEQIRGESLTTSSDVYALGLILYELLTGHQATRFREPGVIDPETVPIRPSQAVLQPKTLPGRDGTTQTLTPEELASVRDASPQVLTRVLGGDLDGIILTALRPEPERRYPTVEALAEDLNRHLNGETVTARGDSRLYRLGVFVRRHRAAVAAGMLAVLSLIIGIVGTTTALFYALKERDRANTNLIQTRKAVDELTQVGRGLLFNQPHLTPIRRQIFEAALPYYRDFVRQANAPETPQALLELSNAYIRIAEITKSEGGHDEVIAAYDASVEASRLALAKQPDSFDAQFALASALSGRSEFQFMASDPHHDRIRSELREAEEILSGLLRRRPESVKAGSMLSDTLLRSANFSRRMNRYDIAITQYQRAIEVCENLLSKNPTHLASLNSLAGSYYNLANIRNLEGDYESAIVLQNRACELNRNALRSYPNLGVNLHGLADALVTLAVYRRKAGQLDRGLGDLEEAVPILERLAANYPTVIDYQQTYAEALNMRAVFENDLDGEGAIDLARAARDCAEALVGRAGLVTEYQLTLSRCCDTLGLIAKEHGESEVAIEAFTRGVEVLGSISNPDPAELNNATRMLVLLSQLHSKAGDLEAAGRALKEALTVSEYLTNQNVRVESIPKYQNAQGIILGRLTRVERDLGHLDEAWSLIQRSRDLGEDLIRRYPDNPSFRSTLSVTCNVVGEIALLRGDPQAALNAHLRAGELNAGLPLPEMVNHYNKACCLALTAKAARHIDPSPKPPAMHYVDRALQSLRAAITEGWDDLGSLRTDSDLDEIRDHPEFQQILEELANRENPES